MTGILAMAAKFRRVSFLCAFLLICNQGNAATFLAIFPKGEKPGGLAFFISMLTGLFAALAAHELGHLLTGLAQGFRFELFVVGPLGIKREEGKIKVYFNTNLGYMGGIAATMPVKERPDNRIRFARAILAGPLSSLLFAAICFACLGFSHGAFRSFWLVSGACSLSLFFATTLPRKSGIFFTDRARYQRLTGNGAEAKAEEALLEILAKTTVEGNSKNISLTGTKLMKDDREPFIMFWGYYYEWQHYKDNENDDAAEEARQQLLLKKNTIPASIWKALQIE
jgi:hypothetical protein